MQLLPPQDQEDPGAQTWRPAWPKHCSNTLKKIKQTNTKRSPTTVTRVLPFWENIHNDLYLKNELLLVHHTVTCTSLPSNSKFILSYLSWSFRVAVGLAHACWGTMSAPRRSEISEAITTSTLQLEQPEVQLVYHFTCLLQFCLSLPFQWRQHHSLWHRMRKQVNLLLKKNELCSLGVLKI